MKKQFHQTYVLIHDCGGFEFLTMVRMFRMASSTAVTYYWVVVRFLCRMNRWMVGSSILYRSELSPLLTIILICAALVCAGFGAVSLMLCTLPQFWHSTADRCPPCLSTRCSCGSCGEHGGQVEKAIEYYENALTIGKEIKDPRMIDFCEKNLGSLKNSGD